MNDDLTDHSQYWWAQLGNDEQRLLWPKLMSDNLTNDGAESRIADASLLLHEIMSWESATASKADRLLTLQNFVRQVGAMSQAWAQVNTIVGVAYSYLEITVWDCSAFLSALRDEEFAVNSWMERMSRWVGQGHRFDSARALTEYRHDPQLHLVNDRADEAAYGPNYFFVHWDAQSVYARQGSLIGRIAAGRTHAHHPATPQQVAEYLQRAHAPRDQRTIV